jgi:hypothetical protein
MALPRLVVDFYAYILACWKHWRFLLTSSGFVVVLAFYERFSGLTIQVGWYFGLLFFLLLYASFLVWRDERQVTQSKSLPEIAYLKLFFEKTDLCYQKVKGSADHSTSHRALRVGITNSARTSIAHVKVKVVGTEPELDPPLFGHFLKSYPDHHDVIEVPPSEDQKPQVYVDLANVEVFQSRNRTWLRWHLAVGASPSRGTVEMLKVKLRIEHPSGVQDHYGLTFGRNGTEVAAGMSRVKDNRGTQVRDPWE